MLDHTGFGRADLGDRALPQVSALCRGPADRHPLPREVTRDAHWVEPELVGEVAYAHWTAEGRLRHPSWRGLRDDIDPDDVVEEW